MAGRRIKSSLFVAVTCICAIASYFQFVYTNSVAFSLVYASLNSNREENETGSGANETAPYETTTSATELDGNYGSRNDALDPDVNSSGSAESGGRVGRRARRTEVRGSGMKKILLWTPKYGNPDFGIGFGRAGFIRKGCAESRCYVTDDHSLADTVDAILFHARDTSASTMPPRSNPDQIWIFYSLESPLTVGGRIRGTNDRYNLTVTYMFHPDTDVVTRIRKLKPPSGTTTPEQSVRRKRKLAVWPVSNCVGALSSRNEYARALSRYVDVDVYGRCGNHSCPIDEKTSCYSKFESEYYFYLSFENSVCEQYVTEKVYAVLRRNIVPVILGGGDYDETLPPRSFLDVRAFESPRHLARYMSYLRSNSTAYLEHLAWKTNAKEHIVRINSLMPPSYGKSGAFCRLCEILHNASYPYKSNFDIENYWNSDKLCLSGFKERRAVHLI